MKQFLLLLLLALLPGLALAQSSAINFGAVGPLISGYQGTDPVAYTPTFSGFGTMGSSTVYWWRVGDRLVVQGTGVIGTPSGTLSISLPSGLAIDTTKVGVTSDLGNFRRVKGAGTFSDTNNGPFVVFQDGSTNNAVFIAKAVTSTTAYTKMDSSALTASDGISFYFSVPIQGWASTAIASSERIGRATIANNGTASITSQTSNFISSVSRTAAGKVQVNFAAGFFSGTPSCSCIANDDGITGGGWTCTMTEGTRSSTQMTFTTTNAFTLADLGFSIICMGPN